jgi:hypothetical protein
MLRLNLVWKDVTREPESILSLLLLSCVVFVALALISPIT